MNKTLTLACAIAAPLLFSQSAVAEFDYFKTDGSFKRFSVSAGWLHASPQGKANPMQTTTAAKDGTVADNGSVKVKTVREVLVKDQDRFGFIDGTLKGLGAETGVCCIEFGLSVVSMQHTQGQDLASVRKLSVSLRTFDKGFKWPAQRVLAIKPWLLQRAQETLRLLLAV